MSPRYDNRSLVGRRGAENERYPLIPSRNSQAKLRNYAGKFVTQRSQNVNGTNINGTLYTLAALEASENLGLGYGGVLILAQVGANSSQPASIYGGTAFLPGAFNYTGPTWYNFVNNNPAQGVISSTYETAAKPCEL